MKKGIISLVLPLLFTFQIGSALASRQPIIKDGRYYYSETDTHQHINLPQALWYLARKLPGKVVSKAVSLFVAQEKRISAVEQLNPTQSIPETYSMEPKIIWLGHATFLIQMNGFNIITDPIFDGIKVGPFTLSKRVLPIGVTFENLPPIDAILISHNHTDHTDTESLMLLAQRDDPAVFVPQGDKALFESYGFSQVFEDTWGNKHELTRDDRTVRLDFLPAYHWSIRFSLTSYRKSLWGSWMISANDKNIYFAGDTAYGDHFKEIAQEYPSIDMALMPIGPTHEGEFNDHKSHVDARQALDGFTDLGARCFVPMHYGTFDGKREMREIPIKVLHEIWAAKQAELADKKLLFARCGEQYTV